MVPKKMMQRTAGSRVRARVDAGPPMGKRGRLRADGHALTGPGSVASQLPGLGEGGIGLGVPSEGLKSNAFAIPGRFMVRVQP